MPYSQKYCLVSFILPIDTGTEFTMADWPLHITLADVFAIDLVGTDIEIKLAELLSNQLAFKTVANKEVILGTTKVVLLDSSKELTTLHARLVDLLEKHGAVFNTPEFIKEGFVPHCTIQKTRRLYDGDEVTINTIALVDMFPNEDWRQRKIINTFGLQSGRPS